jgi:hypothetical protein
LSQSKEVGSVAAEPGKASGAILSKANGRDYLLVLRNKIILSVYPLDAPE